MKETLQILNKYIKANIEFLKLELKIDFADLIARMVFVILVGVTFLLMLLMLSFAGAHYLNHVLKGNYIGFVLMAGIFLGIGFTLLAIGKHTKIIRRIKDYILINLK
ncbi:MAG: phage holin family protein [Bacteroidota bacterium]